MNAVLLVGRLGKLDHRETRDKAPYVTFSVATTEWDGHAEQTVWHRCAWFNPTELAKSLEKGQQMAVRGELSYRTDEHDRERAFVRVRQIETIGPKPSNRRASR